MKWNYIALRYHKIYRHEKSLLWSSKRLIVCHPSSSQKKPCNRVQAGVSRCWDKKTILFSSFTINFFARGTYLPIGYCKNTAIAITTFQKLTLTMGRQELQNIIATLAQYPIRPATEPSLQRSGLQRYFATIVAFHLVNFLACNLLGNVKIKLKPAFIILIQIELVDMANSNH